MRMTDTQRRINGLKTWLPKDTEEEEDDKEWFWFDKNGKLYRADMDRRYF